MAQGYEPVALLSLPSGHLWALGSQLEIARLGPFGGQALIIDYASPSQAVNEASAIAHHPSGGLALVGRIGPMGGEGGRVVRANGFGHSGCGAAGACVGVAASACDDLDPCTVGSCVVATGECAFTALPEGSACGPSLTCQAGACQ